MKHLQGHSIPSGVCNGWNRLLTENQKIAEKRAKEQHEKFMERESKNFIKGKWGEAIREWSAVADCTFEVRWYRTHIGFHRYCRHKTNDGFSDHLAINVDEGRLCRNLSPSMFVYYQNLFDKKGLTAVDSLLKFIESHKGYFSYLRNA